MPRLRMIIALSCALLLSLQGCLFPAGAMAAGIKSPSARTSTVTVPDEYKTIMETYHDVIYADWYVALTANDLLNMGVCPLLADFKSSEKESFGYYLEDINGDGTPELFIGINNDEYNDTVYQLFTVYNGEAVALYTAMDADAVYLMSNGLLEYTTWEVNGGYGICLYRFEKDGSMSVTDGIMYDESAKNGPWFSVTDDRFSTTTAKAINEQTFNDKLDDYLRMEKMLRYEPFTNWNHAASASGSQAGNRRPANRQSSSGNTTASSQSTGSNNSNTSSNKQTTGSNSSSASSNRQTNGSTTTSRQTTGGNPGGGTSVSGSNSTAASGLTYNLESMIDTTTGTTVANVLVPNGWNTQLSVNWNFMDTTTPGVATLFLASPDGRAGICLISNMQFYDMHQNATHLSEGTDSSLYMTRLNYRNASEMQSYLLQSDGFTNARLIKTFEISDSLTKLLQEAAQVKLSSLISSIGGTAIASEGSAAHNLYQSGNYYLEYITTVTAAAISNNTGHVTLNTITWNVPISAVFFTDSKQSYEQYRDVFLNVYTNSSFSLEFHYVNQRYGNQISSLISQGLLQQAERYLKSGSSSWVSEYESSSGYDSSKFINGWSDVIKDQNDYTTLDGQNLKISTSVDTVYQSGDQIYMGPESQSPLGWTRLYPN